MSIPILDLEWTQVIPEKRITDFIDKHELLKKQTDDDLCKLSGPILDNQVVKSGEKGIHSNVFFIKGLKLSAKIMEDIDINRKEINFYRDFTGYVIGGGCTNFPLVSVHRECKVCKSDDPKFSENCLVLYSELFDGSLNDLVNNFFEEKSDQRFEFWGMFMQIAMALLVLEKNKLVHGDLHLGNILFIYDEKSKGSYLHYIDYDIGRNYYVKHTGRLYVLWDFGRMCKNGEVDSDGFKITNTLKHDIPNFTYQLKKFNKKQIKKYEDMVEEIEKISSISDLFEKYKDLGMLIINPEEKWFSQNKIVNPIPYQI